MKRTKSSIQLGNPSTLTRMAHSLKKLIDCPYSLVNSNKKTKTLSSKNSLSMSKKQLQRKMSLRDLDTTTQVNSRKTPTSNSRLPQTNKFEKEKILKESLMEKFEQNRKMSASTITIKTIKNPNKELETMKSTVCRRKEDKQNIQKEIQTLLRARHRGHKPTHQLLLNHTKTLASNIDRPRIQEKNKFAEEFKYLERELCQIKGKKKQIQESINQLANRYLFLQEDIIALEFNFNEELVQKQQLEAILEQFFKQKETDGEILFELFKKESQLELVRKNQRQLRSRLQNIEENIHDKRKENSEKIIKKTAQNSESFKRHLGEAQLKQIKLQLIHTEQELDTLGIHINSSFLSNQKTKTNQFRELRKIRQYVCHFYQQISKTKHRQSEKSRHSVKTQSVQQKQKEPIIYTNIFMTFDEKLCCEQLVQEFIDFLNTRPQIQSLKNRANNGNARVFIDLVQKYTILLLKESTLYAEVKEYLLKVEETPQIQNLVKQKKKLEQKLRENEDSISILIKQCKTLHEQKAAREALRALTYYRSLQVQKVNTSKENKKRNQLHENIRNQVSFFMNLKKITPQMRAQLKVFFDSEKKKSQKAKQLYLRYKYLEQKTSKIKQQQEQTSKLQKQMLKVKRQRIQLQETLKQVQKIKQGYSRRLEECQNRCMKHYL